MLHSSIQNIIYQLTEVLNLLSLEQYVIPSQRLNQSNIGQHVRHIIEMFEGLENGYEKGFINYENRRRDKTIEINKDLAIKLLNDIPLSIGKAEKDLILETCPDEVKTNFIQIKTNYQRELAYNLDHAIHHMAMIRVVIKEVTDLELPDNFGMAFSTIKHKITCAP